MKQVLSFGDHLQLPFRHEAAEYKLSDMKRMIIVAVLAAYRRGVINRRPTTACAPSGDSPIIDMFNADRLAYRSLNPSEFL